MALGKCRECSKEVSSEAKNCPSCGVANPIKKGTSKIVIFIAAIIGIGVLKSIFDPAPAPVATPKVELTAEEKAAEIASNVRFSTAVAVLKAIKSDLKDPSSVQWSKVGVSRDADVVCVEFRAKNSFGALELENITIAKGKASKSPDVWNKNCVNKELFDELKARHAVS
jgi:hypothetical protein